MNMKVVHERSAVLSFRREQRNRLYCLSRTFLFYGLLVLGIVLGLELLLWDFSGLAILKLPAATLLLCSLAVAYLLPRRFREGLRIWQGANLAVLSCTAAVQLFLLLASAARTAEWQSVVLGESIATLGLVYLFGYPFRRTAVMMAGVPYAVAAVAALVVYGGGAPGLSLLALPVPVLLGLALVARVEERLAFKTFRMRRIAERGKAKLEEELTREGVLVKQLEEARSALTKEVEERKRIEEGLERIAAFDELTSVYNRRAGLEVLK
jgi:signal transduction histidine kinase